MTGTGEHDAPIPGMTGDYGYDLAHDVPSADAHASPSHQPTPIQVVTESSDQEQDYSYDLAHDIPRTVVE